MINRHFPSFIMMELIVISGTWMLSFAAAQTCLVNSVPSTSPLVCLENECNSDASTSDIFTIEGCQEVDCQGNGSCDLESTSAPVLFGGGTQMTNIGNLLCSGRQSCQNLEVDGIQELRCAAFESCADMIVSNIADGAVVRCDSRNACFQSILSAEAGGSFTLLCGGTGSCGTDDAFAFFVNGDTSSFVQVDAGPDGFLFCDDNVACYGLVFNIGANGCLIVGFDFSGYLIEVTGAIDFTFEEGPTGSPREPKFLGNCNEEHFQTVCEERFRDNSDSFTLVNAENPSNSITYNCQFPTAVPSVSAIPSISPSLSPSKSMIPSLSPSLSPSKSMIPSLSPSLFPSNSMVPSMSPSLSPSKSMIPSMSPSQFPSKSMIPSMSPSISPTRSPTRRPTHHPTRFPTPNPTTFPTPNPTMIPTMNPTSFPTSFPTMNPTSFPTTMNPTELPSSIPTTSPTMIPSVVPSVVASLIPSLSSQPSDANPTSSPSRLPSSIPSVFPSMFPTTEIPTFEPTSKTSDEDCPWWKFILCWFGGHNGEEEESETTSSPTLVPTTAPTRVVEKSDCPWWKFFIFCLF